MTQQTFSMDNAWRLMLVDMGVDADELLRRAELPRDLFSREAVKLPAPSFFRLWDALAEMFDDPELALKIGQALSTEHFSPPIFAALCSPCLSMAASRLSAFKRLVGPMRLIIEETDDLFSVTYEFLQPTVSPSATFIEFELVFLVRLARIALREEIQPVRVVSTFAPFHSGFTDFFGVAPEKGEREMLCFSREDASKPFLTANESMWDFFEPTLRKRLSELDGSESTADRVMSCLYEQLPGGQTSIREVARSLGMSTRTLQRRLKQEETSFQELLSQCREQLARHYLQHSTMSGAEISFLLGFDEPNSFFRAFHAWTGQTPERVRATYQHPN